MQPCDTARQRTSALGIHADIAAKLNFAAHQNAFSVLRRLETEYLDDEQREDNLVLNLQSCFSQRENLASRPDCSTGVDIRCGPGN